MLEDPENKNQTASEPEFQAFRKRILTGGLIICVIGVPIGIALGIPYVWGLSIIGIIVASFKLATVMR